MASRSRQVQASLIKVQRARQLTGQPTYGFFGDLLGGVGKAVASVIPGGNIVTSVVGSLFGGGDDRSSNQPLARADCPPGFQADPNTGVCQAIGLTGAVQRFLPGGQTGVLPSTAQPMAATVGQFGAPAIQPYQASSVALRCPPGMVLGKDNLCYRKGAIPMSWRKWRPARKPPISARDWRALQTADRVKNRAKKIAGKAGFSCKRR